MRELYGDKIGASDGEIGHVKDFYFDDANWGVRYVVADTGSWLPKRQVLISPHSLGQLTERGNVLEVNLTRKQIEESPSIESHKPISRQHEEDYYRYYGWPYYWLGGGLWGMSGFPILDSAASPFPSEQVSGDATDSDRIDNHLRSTKAVAGYHLEATDGMVGYVCDFLMDVKTWAIAQLIIKTGHRFSGKEIAIHTGHVDRISYDSSSVFVNLNKAEAEKSAGHQLSPAALKV